jgi:hypothetical protein
MKFTSSTTPAILRVTYPDSPTQWKVSPYGLDDTDRDAVWCDSRAEAEVVATKAAARLQEAEENQAIFDYETKLEVR